MPLQIYNFTVLYHSGKRMYITDTFKGLHGVSCSNEKDDIWEAEYIPVTERRLFKLRTTTRDDQSMQQFILEEWPDEKIQINPEVRPYFSFQHVIFQGSHVVVPLMQHAVL